MKKKTLERITRDPINHTVTVALKVPVAHGPKTLSEVTLRDTAVVADLEAMDQGTGEMEKTLYLVEALSGVSLAVLRQMRAADYTAVAEVIGDIMGNDA